MTEHNNDLAMLDMKEVEQLLRRKARTIRLMVSRGDFPKPIVSGRWLRADVVRHLHAVNEVAESGKKRQDSAAIGISQE